ncbi:interferon-induced protein 44-like isoform X2 [Sebastes umbrosus]|uniref:interferon-induced protein 44-like isoform X2 n=1 Tax=Sebastes umbrosus TaxID=72105 RepID=UPI00189EE57E|nr:interferon-induced protein 44-like isoform X2 [Sebastes umbrosus]
MLSSVTVLCCQGIFLVFEGWLAKYKRWIPLSHAVGYKLKLKKENESKRIKYKICSCQHYHLTWHSALQSNTAYFSQPWRAMPKDNQENLDFVKSYQPRNKEVKHLRILLHGPVGAGKSSFINSVESVLKGRVTVRALTDAISGSSFTQNYTTFKIHKDPESFYSFIFNDIMGFEQETDSGVPVEDVKLALRGHVKEGYKFVPGGQLKETDQDYKLSPTLDDRVHVLVSVIPVNSVSLMSDKVVKKMRDIRLSASEMGIPQLAILTKVDEAFSKGKKNIDKVYKNKYLKKMVNQFSMLLGLPPNCIFLVKNYESESNTNDDTDALILSALRQMITFGEDFLDNL